MNEALWTIEAMIDAMGAEPQGTMPDGVSGISIDTRTLEPGDAYFAIQGDVHDGHKFVANAEAAGAALSVVAKDKLHLIGDASGPLLIVDEVLPALERLGTASRKRNKGRILAVTGSVGKTTTKEGLKLALAPTGKVHASVASYNNHWGVPLTLARMPQDTDFGIFEIGMNHPGEISPLVKMVRPHVAMITNVAAVHLGAFSSVDEIAHAKGEIFDGLDADGVAILNADDERLQLLRNIAKKAGVTQIATFGEAADADAHMDRLVLHGSCSCLTGTIDGTSLCTKIGAPGRHIVQNVLAILLASKRVGADLAEASLAMAQMQAVKGRGERHRLSHPDGRIVLIDESYNANPTSVSAALALLGNASPKDKGQRIAVLGDMLELGPTADELHASLARAVLDAKVDQLFLAGPEMVALAEALKGKIAVTHQETIDYLIPMVVQQMRGGDVVMVKASLGMRFARLVDHLLDTFPVLDE